MLLGVQGNFFEHGVDWCLRVPLPGLRGEGGVEDDPREIEGARRGIGEDFARAETRGAPVAELGEGETVRGAAGEVDDAGMGRRRRRRGRRRGRGGELLMEEGGEVAWMEAVADLVAGAAEAEVLSGARRSQELIQKLKMPCSGWPNWPAPAMTPQRFTQTGNPNAWPYSSASTSEASLVLP